MRDQLVTEAILHSLQERPYTTPEVRRIVEGYLTIYAHQHGTKPKIENDVLKRRLSVLIREGVINRDSRTGQWYMTTGQKRRYGDAASATNLAGQPHAEEALHV